MRKQSPFCWSVLLGILAFALPVLAEMNPVVKSEDSIEKVPPGYALVMANGMTLKVAEYLIDLEKETIYFKSKLSGLSATFPLERILRVVSYDARMSDVPEDASLLFIPERTAGDDIDDGGIPVLFKVTKTLVSSGGGNTGYSRAGGSGQPDSRQSYTPSRSSSRTSSSSASSSRNPTSQTSSTNRPTSSSSSSNNAANSFFDALFGGK